MPETSYIKIMNDYKKTNGVNEIIKRGTEHHCNVMKLVEEKK
jgi:hypothetical protein